MNSLTVLGKYLDQPRLVTKFSNSVPLILLAGGGAYTYESVKKAPEAEKQNELIRNSIIIAATIGSAVIAPKVAAIVIKYLKNKHLNIHEHHNNSHYEHVHNHEDCHGSEHQHANEHEHEHEHEHDHDHDHAHDHEHGGIMSLKEIKEKNTMLVDNFLKENHVTLKISTILNKAKEKILNPSEIKTVFEGLEQNPKSKEFLSGEDGLIPNPENIDSNHIFGEIGRISILGLIPVLGGITGGIVGDKITDKNWKDKIPNKVKEGTYQYLANIFLCNVGAGAALFALEKANIKSKAARAFGMITGIILAGIVFGSAIANLIGKVFVDPLFHKDDSHGHSHIDLYSERTPEAIDIGLHIDDVATVAVMSGLKWIEPALPILYSVSGYRAGIGYRNVSDNKPE